MDKHTGCAIDVFCEDVSGRLGGYRAPLGMLGVEIIGKESRMNSYLLKLFIHISAINTNISNREVATFRWGIRVLSWK